MIIKWFVDTRCSLTYIYSYLLLKIWNAPLTVAMRLLHLIKPLHWLHVLILIIHRNSLWPVKIYWYLALKRIVTILQTSQPYATSKVAAVPRCQSLVQQRVIVRKPSRV